MFQAISASTRDRDFRTFRGNLFSVVDVRHVPPSFNSICMRFLHIIYAAICSKCDLIYVEHTGTELKDRFAKHRHDTKKRPDNSELAEYFHTWHDDGDMEVLFLESRIYTEEKKRGKWGRTDLDEICRPTGINKSTTQDAKDMYTTFRMPACSTLTI